MQTLNDILDIVRSFKVRLEWHSYRAVPSAHCFATWNIPRSEFDGADEMVFQKHYPLEVTFFYRENKTEGDFSLENKFEQAVREAGDFTAVYDYDSERDLFYTQYVFRFTEDI